jgi:hypothetical protein
MSGSNHSSIGVCHAMSEPVVRNFHKLLLLAKSYGGSLTKDEKNFFHWSPSLADNSELLVAANEVLQHFYSNYGGIWTGCYKMRPIDCRGAFACEHMNIQMIFISLC